MANQEIKNVVLSYIDKNLNNRLLNHKIKIDNLKIRHFNNDDLIELINNFFKTSKNDSQKFCVGSTILNFLPDVESTNINDNNNKIYKKYKDIRIIYSIITNNKLKDEKLKTKHDLIWTNVENFIMEEIQKMLNELNIEVTYIKDYKGNIIEKLKEIKIKNIHTNIIINLDKYIYIQLLF